MSGFGGGGRGFVPDAGELRLIWITDTHNWDTPVTIRDAGVVAALDEANTWQADAVIHTGDIGDNFPSYVAAAFTLLRSVAITCPLITVIGNHDEYEAVPPTCNTAQLEGSAYFNRSAPFYHTGTITAKNGLLQARWITVDNNFYTEWDADPSRVNVGHVDGDRVGFSNNEPGGGSYRKFGTTQLSWIASTLAADTTSRLILMLLHYPGFVKDYQSLADVLQTDGRQALLLSGHDHPSAHYGIYVYPSTDGKRSYRLYKMAACQESGAYCRVRVRLNTRPTSIDPVVPEVSVRNYVDPGGWTISSPFVIL